MQANFLQLIGTISGAFWGALVGSCFSIVGVALTNRANQRRLADQLNHEREAKTKDREMALRKEVYLAAAEATAAGINAVVRFANLDLSADQITSDYEQKAPAIVKVHVIANKETIQATICFTGELDSVFLRLHAQRAELMSEKSAISILDNQVVEFGKERDHILEMIKHHNIEGLVDDRRWNVLMSNFEFEQKRIREASARHDELVKSLRLKQLDLARECVSQAVMLQKLLVPVLISVREELELPIDEVTYCQFIEDGTAKVQKEIDIFIQRASSRIS